MPAFCRDQVIAMAVEVIPVTRFPDLVNHDPKIVGSSYVLGNEALQNVPKNLRAK